MRTELYTPEQDARSFLDALPPKLRGAVSMEIYALTDATFLDGLLVAAEGGVTQRWAVDMSQYTGDHTMSKLLDYAITRIRPTTGAPLPISIKFGQSSKGGIIHSKMLIGTIGPTPFVVKGSYNFTNSAQDECNVLLYDDDPTIVAAAQAHFEHTWATMRVHKLV